MKLHQETSSKPRFLTGDKALQFKGQYYTLLDNVQDTKNVLVNIDWDFVLSIMSKHEEAGDDIDGVFFEVYRDDRFQVFSNLNFSRHESLTVWDNETGCCIEGEDILMNDAIGLIIVGQTSCYMCNDNGTGYKMYHPYMLC